MNCRCKYEGFHYEGEVIRPPSEARSILIQATVGCSHNRCTFCGTYKSKKFRIKEREILLRDIDYAQHHCRTMTRLFLMDGDALIIPTDELIWLLDRINEKLPWVERIGIYANCKSLKRKTLQELEELRKRKLGIIYLGVESGDDEVLKKVRKGADSKSLIEEGKKVMKAGILLSVTVLVGIGGTKGSMKHAELTGKLLTEMDPDYVGALTLMILPNSPLGQEYLSGKFHLPTQEELLLELREMIVHTQLSHGLFTSNHASNYLPLKIKFPHQKQEAIRAIDLALEGEIFLRPEWMRAL